MTTSANAKERASAAHREIMGCFSPCIDCLPGMRSSSGRDVALFLSILTKAGVRVEDVRQLQQNGCLTCGISGSMNLDPARGGFGACFSRGDVALAVMLSVLNEETDVARFLFVAAATEGLWLVYREETKDAAGYLRRAHIAVCRNYRQGDIPSGDDMKVVRTLASALAEISPVPVSLEIRMEDEKFGDWK